MAEAVAAFYAIETAVEGAALGAFAVSRPTVPLHVHFVRKLQSPSPSLGRIYHSLNVIKGKAYVYGGDSVQDEDGRLRADDSVRIMTLGKEGDESIIDYQLIKPEAKRSRPLAGDDLVSYQSSSVPRARSRHTSTAIDDTIYILGGRQPLTDESDHESTQATSTLYDCDVIYGFDTLTNTWFSVLADQTVCFDGIPPPRNGASCTSSPHPKPGTTTSATIEAHGTLFLHGGYDANGAALHDTWLFDLSLRKWTRGPDLPRIGPEEVAGEGRIQYVNGRLWRVGDGFGKMLYLELAETDGMDVQTNNTAVPSVELITLTWQSYTFGETAATTDSDATAEKEISKDLITKTESLPVPRQEFGFLSITTGAGREYLLFFLGADGPTSLLANNDFWSFQIQSDGYTAAAAKDKARDVVGTASGANQWARCEVVQSTKESGQVDMPLGGLSGFASDTWPETGDGATIVLWGGKDGQGQTKNEGWLVKVT